MHTPKKNVKLWQLGLMEMLAIVCGLLRGAATATPPYTCLQMNKWTTQRPGGISLNKQGCRFLKLSVIQLVVHMYRRQTNYFHCIKMKYSEYMGNNKDSYA